MIATRIVQGLCLVLGLLAALEGGKLVRDRDPTSTAGISPISVPPDPDPRAGPLQEGGNRQGGAEKEDGGALPARYAVIVSSGIFGKVEEKPPAPPALIGLMDGLEKKYALLRGADGKKFRIAEGEETNGVKLLRIGRNRVLIEHAGRRHELTLFGGLGGETLAPPEAEGEAENGTPQVSRPEEPPP